MRDLAVALVFAVFPTMLPAAEPPHPDFSGTWNMDMSRSESAHQAVPIGPVTLVIHQRSGQLKVETRRAGDLFETLDFHLNGTDEKTSGNSGVQVTAKAHWDGVRLVTETEREINGATVTTMQIYTLSSGGKELVVRKTLNVQHGYQSPVSSKSTGTGTDIFVKASGK